MRAPQIHHVARRRGGGVAARGAGAAVRAGATGGHTNGRRLRAIKAHKQALRRVRQGLGGIGLDRRTQPANRFAIGQEATATFYENTRTELVALQPGTSSSLLVAAVWDRCNRQPAPCRSCSHQ